MCKQRVWNHHRQRKIPHVHEDANVQVNRNAHYYSKLPSLFPVDDNWKGELKKHNHIGKNHRNEIGKNLRSTLNCLIAKPITHKRLINGFARQPLPTGEFVYGSVEVNQSNLNSRCQQRKSREK